MTSNAAFVVRYGAVGLVNTAAYYSSYLVFHLLMVYWAAHLLALVVAMVVSFFLNCWFTFRTKPTWRKFALFPLGNAANYVITTVGVVALVSGFGVNERIAPLIAALVAVPFTFVLYKLILLGRTADA
ncbi:MAG: GtrA family protein [Rhodococcus sp. (in: high G+C Gram-positive bacteria)]